ncbi:MAG: YedE-related selenium metabolism membrane protein [Spirochaetaceae bacterium]|nr:YedE-related selenium metabolism membrane protein [Spirochaetaceae bacterium]
MKSAKNHAWIIVTGAIIGGVAVMLGKLGNPANMGLCIACFTRDIAGALGLDGTPTVQYLRPEIPGILLGAFGLALFRREWNPLSGKGTAGESGVLIRFVIAFFVMLGCLVALGCPLRMAIRLGSGDFNAIAAIAGFFAGIGAGCLWLRKGFSLGKSADSGTGIRTANSLLLPLLAVALLVFVVIQPSFIKFSEQGPGSQHAPVIVSLVAALLIGLLCQKSDFCIAGGIRDIFLLRKAGGFFGYLMIILVVFMCNIILGNFKPGFAGQPIAHQDQLWNFLGMGLVGYGSVLIEGCPLRQLIKAGNGNSGAGICIFAFLLAGATAHNFGIAASPSGVPLNGKIAVLIGFALISFLAPLCTTRKAAEIKA